MADLGNGQVITSWTESVLISHPRDGGEATIGISVRVAALHDGDGAFLGIGRIDQLRFPRLLPLHSILGLEAAPQFKNLMTHFRHMYLTGVPESVAAIIVSLACGPEDGRWAGGDSFTFSRSRRQQRHNSTNSGHLDVPVSAAPAISVQDDSGGGRSSGCRVAQFGFIQRITVDPLPLIGRFQPVAKGPERSRGGAE